MDNRRISQSLPAAALATFLIFATTGQYAFGDNVNADALDSTTLSVSVEEGQTTDIEYFLQANGGDGCNVDATHAASVTLDIPAGVSASPNPFDITECKVGGDNNGVIITFTGLTAGGPYDITVDSVTGGKSGNNGYNTAPADGVDVTVTEPDTPTDTEAPTVILVTVTDLIVSEADDGNTFTVTVQYSESMDQTINPAITFDPAVANTLTNPTAGSWGDSTHFSISYTVDDANVEQSGVDVEVDGAEDVAGNPQTQYTETDAFDIDTIAPTAISAAISDTEISEADVGNTVTVTVEYGEAMDENVNPSTDFDPDVSTTLTSPTAGSWTDSTHFTRDYTVADANVEVETSPDVTIQVTGGKDLAGNMQDAFDAEDAFIIDTKAPTVSGSADRAPDSAAGWYNHTVTISWTSPDDDDTCDSATVYSGPDTDSSGTSVPGGSCTDNLGNVGTAAVFDLKYDATEPNVSLVGGPAEGGSYFFGFVPSAPTCNASDPTPGSGLAGTCSVTGYSTAVGQHTVMASAIDDADNRATDSNSYEVKGWILTGFYQPVDMSPNAPTEIVWNSLKGGQTAPLKFEIFADTEFTSTTFNSSPIGTFKTQKISCTTDPTTQEDPMELTTTGGTSFRYDATSGQFIQNWQTTKSMAGSCFKATFTAQDGSALTAYFKVK